MTNLQGRHPDAGKRPNTDAFCQHGGVFTPTSAYRCSQWYLVDDSYNRRWHLGALRRARCCRTGRVKLSMLQGVPSRLQLSHL